MQNFFFSLRGASVRHLAMLVLLLCLGAQEGRGQCSPLPVFNRTFNNQTVMAAGTFTNENIRITGNVNFDANITMVRCTVLLDPNAVLTIRNNSVFRVEADFVGNRSVFYGCGTMWKSITVNQGCALILRNSLIQDGRSGLVFINGFNNALSEIVGNIFTRNSVAITATNVNNFTFSAFSGNIFVGRQNISPLLPPHLATDPINAFRLNAVVGTIGSSGAANFCFAFSTAMRMRGSTITVNNFFFSGNTLTDQFGANNSGIGIWASISRLTIQNIFSNNASCYFTANRRGIRSDSTIRLTVKDAVFTNHQNLDIDVANSVFAYNLEIINNKDTLSNPTIGGYSIQRCAHVGGVHTRVQSNIMVLRPAFALANPIRFIFFPIPRPMARDQAIIANNQIFCTYGNGPQGNVARTIDGIWIIGNADGYQLSGNIINFVNPAGGMPNAQISSTGISMTQVQGMRNIVGPNNTITTTRFAAPQPQARESWLRCGIHTDASNIAICKNDVDDPHHAYHFQFNCAAVEFGRNKIQDADYGLEIWGAIPNNHDHRLNQWLGAYSAAPNGLGARNLAPPANLSWFVDATAANNPLGLMPPSFAPPNWFRTQLNGGASGTPICDAVVPPPGAFGEPPTGDIVRQYLDGGYGGLSTPAATWDFERTLLSQMMRFPNTYAGNTEAEQYYASKINSSVWKFAHAERILHDAFPISAQTQAALDQLQESARVLIDSLSQIEAWEGVDTTTVSPVWQASKLSLLTQLAANQELMDQLVNAVLAQHSSSLPNVQDYINDLPESTELESNLKTVLYLRSKKCAGQAWTASDSLMLRSVAYGCPEVDGEVVTTAREMLPPEEAFSFGRDGLDPNCGSGANGGVEDRHPQVATLGMMSVWPNPANDLLAVSFGKPSKGTLDIINSTGLTVFTTPVEDANQTAVNLAALSKGIYFARFSAPGSPAQVRRFVIVR